MQRFVVESKLCDVVSLQVFLRVVTLGVSVQGSAPEVGRLQRGWEDPQWSTTFHLDIENATYDMFD